MIANSLAWHDARIAERVPRAVEGEPGMFVVDATWGALQPISLAPGVRTVLELEVIEHLRAARPLVDCRLPQYVGRGTIPGAGNIPHGEMAARIAELNAVDPIVVFSNGPQYPASAQAIEALLAVGSPAERLLYYRGGIHDWVTLGLSPRRGGELKSPRRRHRRRPTAAPPRRGTAPP